MCSDGDSKALQSQNTTGLSTAEATSPAPLTGEQDSEPAATLGRALNLSSLETMQICLRQPCPYGQSCNEVHVNRGISVSSPKNKKILNFS